MPAPTRHSFPPSSMFPAFISFLFFLIVSLLLKPANAQLVNGQFFTHGLAISNAPAPNSEFTVGGTISVSVDVSGDGRLPQGSWGPNSTLPSGFISLSIFLVSANQNLTIVNGTTGDFLADEPGSTVKHLNYAIPSCIPEGDYDYTYYEVSRMNGTMYFAITPIPLHIKNPSGSSGACNTNISNPVQQRPQNDSAPAVNPFTGGFTLNTSSAVPASSTVPAYMPTVSDSAPSSTIQIPSPMSSPTPTMEMTSNYNNHQAQAALLASGLVFPIRSSDATSFRSGTGRGAVGIVPRAYAVLLFLILCTLAAV